MKPRYSIVIPVLNSRSTLELVLRCLEAQTFPHEDFECVVVDDGSTDGTLELLRSYKGGLRLNLLANRAGVGRAQSRELGWRQSTGEVVVFLDDDMLVAPGWLEAYHAAFQQLETDVVAGAQGHLKLETKKESARELARLAAVEPQGLLVRDVAGQLRGLLAHAAPGHYPHPVSEQLEQQLPAVCDAYPQSLVAAYSFMASNGAARRSLLERTSGFNPCWRRFDDLELAIRLWELGARFAFASEAAGLHLHDAAQGFEWFTLNELVALFCRHPYHLVLLMHFWGHFHSPGNPAPRHPVFDSLLALASAGASPSEPDGGELFASVYKQPLPADCRYEREKLVQYFSKLPCWSASIIEAELDLAVARGLFVRRDGGQVYFDINHTDNWLRDNTTILQRWLATFVFSNQKTRFLKTQQPSDLLRVRCEGTYEVRIEAATLDGVAGQAVLNIPLPIEHRAQTCVRIKGCSPANLLDYADRSKTMVTGFPLPHREGEDTVISYDFECFVHEFAPVETREPPPSQAELSRFLRPSMPKEYLLRAKALLKQIITGEGGDAYTVARLIYQWIQHNVVFLETPFPYPYYLILDTGLGPCMQQTRLFINLCRLMGIPAREQVGALLPYDFSLSISQSSIARGVGFSPFIHTWSEFYDAARGWVPIEIHGFGRKCVTGLNVTDPRRLRQLEEAYDDIYRPLIFGSMHPFRVYCSEQANKLPSYPLVKSERGLKPLPAHLPPLLYILTCQLSFPEQEHLFDRPSTAQISGQG